MHSLRIYFSSHRDPEAVKACLLFMTRDLCSSPFWQGTTVPWLNGTVLAVPLPMRVPVRMQENNTQISVIVHRPATSPLDTYQSFCWRKTFAASWDEPVTQRWASQRPCTGTVYSPPPTPRRSQCYAMQLIWLPRIRSLLADGPSRPCFQSSSSLDDSAAASVLRDYGRRTRNWVGLWCCRRSNKRQPIVSANGRRRRLISVFSGCKWKPQLPQVCDVGVWFERD